MRQYGGLVPPGREVPIADVELCVGPAEGQLPQGVASLFRAARPQPAGRRQQRSLRPAAVHGGRRLVRPAEPLQGLPRASPAQVVVGQQLRRLGARVGVKVVAAKLRQCLAVATMRRLFQPQLGQGPELQLIGLPAGLGQGAKQTLRRAAQRLGRPILLGAGQEAVLHHAALQFVQRGNRLGIVLLAEQLPRMGQALLHIAGSQGQGAGTCPSSRDWRLCHRRAAPRHGNHQADPAMGSSFHARTDGG